MSLVVVAAATWGVLAVVDLAYSFVRLSIGARSATKAVRSGGSGYRDSGRSAELAPHVAFLIVVPMLREEAVVRSTWEFFEAALRRERDVELLFVTGEDELRERDAAIERLLEVVRVGGRDASRDDVRVGLRSGSQVDFVECIQLGDWSRANSVLREGRRPTTDETLAELEEEVRSRHRGGYWSDAKELLRISVRQEEVGKVGKLNAAVRWADGRGMSSETYIGVYDVDSRPDLDVLRHIREVIDSRRRAGEACPAVFQQVSAYCAGLAPTGGLRLCAQLADALAQTRWALGFEYALYERYSNAVRRGKLRPLVYCVGHGCFVSLGFLRSAGGFPVGNAADDLALGYLASVLGAEVSPLPSIDVCDVAPSPISSIRQSRFWFLGSCRFWKDIARFRRDVGRRVSTVQLVFLYLNGHARNVAWAGRAVFWLGGLVACVLARQWYLVALLVLVHILWVQVGFLVTLGEVRRLRVREEAVVPEFARRTLVVSCGIASIMFLVRSIGPLTGVVQTLCRLPTRSWKAER